GWRAFYEASGCLQQCALLAARDKRLSEEKRKALREKYEVRALELARAASKGDVDDPTTQNRLAMFLALQPHLQKEDAPRAVELAQKAVRQAPKSVACLIALGAAHYRAGQWREAVSAVETAAKYGPKNVYGQLFWAMAQWQLGEKKDLARQAFTEVEKWM